MECFKCGVPGTRALLFEVISDRGIVQICKKCSQDENLPILKVQKNYGEPPQTVRERLSSFAGVSLLKNNLSKVKSINPSQEENLRKLVEKNALELAEISKKMIGLVDNFHWIIMRARRMKKLTKEQFAKEIGEPVSLVLLAEKGVIPAGKESFVKKIESFLGIKIIKGGIQSASFEEEVEKVKDNLVKKANSGIMNFDESTSKMLTISDLKEMKKKREMESMSEKESKDYNEETAKNSSEAKRELSDKEIDDLIFGRR